MKTHSERPMRILVVDDNRDVADSLAVLLQMMDFDTCTAYSGNAALEVAGGYRPDVVVLDLNMPGMDGLQTARSLRSDRRLSRATFIAYTAADEPFIRRLASQMGFDHVIAKGNVTSLTTMLDSLREIGSRALSSRRNER